MAHNLKIKVAIALSGGVDSAVAAKMLKDEGHEVIGLFLKLWKYDGVDTSENKAREVADYLEIPFYCVDAKEKFKDIVVENFISEYKSCRTPNPCVICNPEVKFKLLIKKAGELGCDKVATGHYARIKNAGIVNNQYSIINKISNNQFPINNEMSNYAKKLQAASYKLKSGIDETKDQSYMLYRLDQHQLSKISFPLGEMTKKEVRAKAIKWHLPVAEEKESQEICFLHSTDYRDFLRNILGEDYVKPGDIVDAKGNIVGRHEGLVSYTIGQRKGVAQETRYKKQDTKPMYVIGFDAKNNRLIVGENEETYQKEMKVSNMNWIVKQKNRKIEEQKNIEVKIRSQAKRVSCRIKNSELKIKDNKISVIFDEPQRAVTPGQSAVFYSGDDVLGGGVITR